jgi:uncharacterized lipoprotein YmbA
MNVSIRLGAATLALAALSLAGCVGSPAPRIEYYTLASPNPGVAPPSSTSPSVFVGPISVPAAVDRLQMVLSTGPHAVTISDDHRWAEPLRDGIARVVAETLSRDLASSRVLASRIGAGTPVDYRVSIEVQRFDSSLTEGATIDALWPITTTRGGPARTGRTAWHEAVSEPTAAALAAAHGRALQRVAGDIAGAIRALQSEKKAAG